MRGFIVSFGSDLYLSYLFKTHPKTDGIIAEIRRGREITVVLDACRAGGSESVAPSQRGERRPAALFIRRIKSLSFFSAARIRNVGQWRVGAEVVDLWDGFRSQRPQTPRGSDTRPRPSQSENQCFINTGAGSRGSSPPSQSHQLQGHGSGYSELPYVKMYRIFFN